MNSPSVIIIVLNWMRVGATLKCLESIARLDYPKDRVTVLVVDNASLDHSSEIIQQSCPGITVIQNEENKGYAGGNNVGIQAALALGPDFILILNNDTILDPQMLKLSVSTLADEQAAGVVGPMVYHASEPEIIQSAGGILGLNWHPLHLAENQADIGQFSDSHLVDWLSGCALVTRVETIRQIGLFDERFFSYYEDLDWCLRMKAAGWKIIHVPQAKIWHTGVQPNYQPKPYVTYYMARNQLLLLQKHHAPLGAWVRAISADLRTLLSWTLSSKWKAKKAHRNALWRGMLDFIFQRWGKAEIPG